MGTIPASVLYMAALEVTKSNVGTTTMKLGFSKATTTTIVDCGETSGGRGGGGGFRSNSKAVVRVEGLSAAMASGFSALVTMPLDTIKTRLQVLKGGGGNSGQSPAIAKTLRKLVKEGGLGACYRGLGLRWASMSMSTTTMITTYEFLKRLSTKESREL